MIRRPLELLGLTLAGSALATRVLPQPWAGTAGAALGAIAWIAWDDLRAARLLRWLRNEDARVPPNLPAVWGDIIDRTRKRFKELNRKVRRGDARLQEFLAAIQASPNGVILLDRHGVIEWCNFTAAQHLGLDVKRDLGQHIRHMVRNPDFIHYLNKGDYTSAVEMDGSNAELDRPHRISLHIHEYSKGRKLLLSLDVTDVALAEAMRRDFVANVSHEIRTPLTVLSGFIETMQTLPLQADDRNKFLGLMSQQAQRMQSLLTDLLMLSRLEGSPAPGASERVNADALLQRVVADARALSAVLPHGPLRVAALEGPAFEVLGSRNELLSAMGNIVNNAVRYTPAGGSITVGWQVQDHGAVAFEVTDTGTGIAAEHIPRLTERFYRVDRSRSRDTGGTGLGLAIVKHVLQRHDGYLEIDSQLGQGSTFRMILPAQRVMLVQAESEV